MICGKCQAPLGANAKYCSHCGTAVCRRKLCPQCKKPFEADRVYCDICGSLMKNYDITGALLFQLEGVYRCAGETILAVPQAKGTLSIFDNRIAYTPVQNSAWMGSLFGSVSQTAETYPMSAVRFARVNKRLGAAWLVLGLENEVISLSSLTGGEAALSQAVAWIEEYRLLGAEYE